MVVSGGTERQAAPDDAEVVEQGSFVDINVTLRNAQTAADLHRCLASDNGFLNYEAWHKLRYSIGYRARDNGTLDSEVDYIVQNLVVRGEDEEILCQALNFVRSNVRNVPEESRDALLEYFEMAPGWVKGRIIDIMAFQEYDFMDTAAEYIEDPDAASAFWAINYMELRDTEGKYLDRIRALDPTEETIVHARERYLRKHE